MATAAKYIMCIFSAVRFIEKKISSNITARKKVSEREGKSQGFQKKFTYTFLPFFFFYKKETGKREKKIKRENINPCIFMEWLRR